MRKSFIEFARVNLAHKQTEVDHPRPVPRGSTKVTQLVSTILGSAVRTWRVYCPPLPSPHKAVDKQQQQLAQCTSKSEGCQVQSGPLPGPIAIESEFNALWARTAISRWPTYHQWWCSCSSQHVTARSSHFMIPRGSISPNGNLLCAGSIGP